MKLNIRYFLIIASIIIMSTNSYSAYFCDDKKFSDILVNNKLTSEWGGIPESQIPPDLKTLVISKDNIGGKQICLVPFKVLLFNNDGTFRYLSGKNSSKTEEINGRWKVENSTLIFTLGKNYSSIYKKDSELRYKIVKILHSGTSLKYSGTSYPGIPGIIKTTNDPLKDFADIAISMKEEDLKTFTPIQ